MPQHYAPCNAFGGSYLLIRSAILAFNNCWHFELEGRQTTALARSLARRPRSPPRSYYIGIPTKKNFKIIERELNNLPQVTQGNRDQIRLCSYQPAPMHAPLRPHHHQEQCHADADQCLLLTPFQKQRYSGFATRSWVSQAWASRI